MKLLINHIKRWNKWRKYNTNGQMHQLLVLLGLRRSPTLAFTFTDEETEALHEALLKVIDDNTCVCCGEIIPEGRQVCIKCEMIADKFNELGHDGPILTADELRKILKPPQTQPKPLHED